MSLPGTLPAAPEKLVVHTCLQLFATSRRSGLLVSASFGAILSGRQLHSTYALSPCEAGPMHLSESAADIMTHAGGTLIRS